MKNYQNKKIHILGSSGTLMSGLCRLGSAAGLSVTGSDNSFNPPLGHQLDNCFKYPLEDPIWKESDIIVVGNKFSRNDPLIQEIMLHGKKIISCMEFLEPFLANKKVIAIGGTHGKSTTSSLVAWILDQNGFNPSFLIGGYAKNFKTNARYSDSEYFVLEADEYDTSFFDKTSKIAHLWPHYLLLNTIEFDHGDIFKSFSDIEDVFNICLKKVSPQGAVFSVPQEKFSPIIPNNLKFNEISHIINKIKKTTENIYLYEDEMITWPLLTKTNNLNLALAVSLAIDLKISTKNIFKSVNSFTGVARRAEKIKIDDLEFWHDFGHHPSAIKKTLDALNDFNSKFYVWIEKASNSMKQGIFDQELIDLEGEFEKMKFFYYQKNIVNTDLNFLTLENFVKTCKKDGYCGILFSNNPSTWPQILCEFSMPNQEE